MHQHEQHERNEIEKEKMTIGVVMKCGSEIKFLVTALLILFSIPALLQLLPSPLYCISNIKTRTTAKPTNIASLNSPNQIENSEEKVLGSNVVQRVFNPYGSAAYNFITMGAYRGGLSTFAIIGLSSKPLHQYSKPTYLCEWVPYSNPSSSNDSEKITAVGYKFLPDWGFGRVYTVVVVNCTFSLPINSDKSSVGGSGGKLLLHASTAGGGDSNFNITDTFEVLSESPGSLDLSLYTTSNQPKYDYLYCGSSLYGNLSPQRMREWIAYHVRLFGERSHFVLHDAGGIHEEVMRVLKPWIELGYVTLQDIRGQERFDGYYHNQFMVVNDCLHRYKFDTKWMFFFDVDEYIYISPKYTIKSLLDSLSHYTLFTIEQMPMSSNLCLSAHPGKNGREWGLEKLIYKDVKKGVRRDRKYAIQPRNVYATGVHISLNLVGKQTYHTAGKIKYYHYHGTIAKRSDPCSVHLTATQINFHKTPYILDTTMQGLARTVKDFELKMIGSVLLQTPD